eukprot:Em0001g941a
MTASVGLRHLFCRRQDLCCGLQIPDLRRLNRSKNKWRTYRPSLRNQLSLPSNNAQFVRKHQKNCCFSSPENMRVTSEITTACVNEKYPAPVVQKATKKYFTTLKRRSRLQTNNKLPDARKKQRRLQRKHHEQKEKFSAILQIEYMSSEESAEESGEDEHMGERLKVLLIHTLPWRNQSVNEMFQSLDRKKARKRTPRAAEMCRKRVPWGAEPSSPYGTTAKPPPSGPAWAKVSDC